MIFGSTDDFAIEATLDPAHEKSLLGHVRVWCQGVSIGDIEALGTLGPAHHCLKQLEAGLEGLWREEFAGLSDLDLLNLIDGILYGYRDGDLEARAFVPREYWRFNFISGPSFDRGGKSFVFRQPDGVVLIMNRAALERGVRLTTTSEAFRSAAGQFVAWFEAETQRLWRPASG